MAFGQNTASYAGSDATTGGKWTGVDGGDGYQIANDNNMKAISYGNVSVTASTYTITSSATASPALQVSPGASTYIASTYFAGTNFTINVNLNDGNSHTVALYLLDADSGGQRSETIAVQDASTGASFSTAPTQNFANFSNRLWVSYTVKGNVNFIITSTNNWLNAVVSGIFFGPAGTTPTQPGSQTITFNPIPAQTVGIPPTLTATASSGLTVAYSASTATPTVCTVSGATATFLAPGSCTVTGSQAGDGINWAAASPFPRSFTVTAVSSGPTLTKEYIYLGGKVVAIEN